MGENKGHGFGLGGNGNNKKILRDTGFSTKVPYQGPAELKS
jgi:hypothetical protein